LLKGNQLEIHYLYLCDDELEFDFNAIIESRKSNTESLKKTNIEQRISKEDYLSKVGVILDNIHQGAIYEANFCMEFFAEKALIDPLETYQKLNAISEPPFAVYFKNNHQYLVSASPERYLKKKVQK